MMTRYFLSATALLAIAGCTAQPPSAESEAQAAPTEAQVESPTTASSDDQEVVTQIDWAGTMPVAMRGTFRERAVGDADPTAADCDPARHGEEILTIHARGYSSPDSGGQVMTVESNSGNMIMASFATGDDEEGVRQRFAVSDEGRTLRRTLLGGPDAGTKRYRRCPDG